MKSIGFLVLVAILATACGSTHVAPQIMPAPPVDAKQFAPHFPIVASCWIHSADEQYTEWFEDHADVPVLVTVKEFSGFGNDRRELGDVCSGVIMPGPAGRRLGPSIWAHRTSTTEWVVSGTYFITVANSNRSEGLVDTRDVTMAYERNYGWHFAPVR